MLIKDIINYRTFTYNWDEIEKIPEFAKLKECEQSPKWHKEGNAWVHTRKVCEAASDMCRELGWEYEPYMAILLLASALFHDIGKGTTTKFIKGGWHSYGHEMESERITRKMLWEEDIELRESICALVRRHMEPLDILKSKSPLDTIARLSGEVPSMDMLLCLKNCDIKGSIQEDEESRGKDLQTLSLIRTLASNMNCLDKQFFSMKRIKKMVAGNSKFNVYVMIGLPGSGKSTKANEIYRENIDNGPCIIVSRDSIRAELGFCKPGEKVVCTQEQERKVSDRFNDRILDFIQDNPEGGTIIIDNINLKSTYRKAYTGLFSPEKSADWTYVYVQASSLQENLRRRENEGFTMEMLEEMVMKFDWPNPSEYDNLEISLN